MKKLTILFMTMLFAVTTQGFEGLNGGTSLDIFSRINCAAGITCARAAGGVFSMTSTPTITSGPFTIQGVEATDAILTMEADEADDNGDTWQLRSVASDNSVILQNDTSGSQVTKFTLSTAGLMSLVSDISMESGDLISNSTDDTFSFQSNDEATNLQILGFEAKAASLELAADQSDDAGDSFFLSASITNVLSILNEATSLATISATGDWVFQGTTPTLTIGDAGAEDTAVVFDGAAQDFHIGLEDTSDKLVIGLGSVLGTTSRMAFNSADLNIVLGDATAADVGFIYDGIAQDFHISLDDSEDDLVIGFGNAAGTTDALRIDENQDVTVVQDLLPLSTITGDGGAALVGMLHAQVASTTTTITVAQCGSTFVSDSADVLTLPEASVSLGCRLTFICGTADDFSVDTDGTDSIGIGSVVTGTNTTLIIAPSAGEQIYCTDVGAGFVLEAAGTNLWAIISTNGVIAEETP